MWTSLSSFKSDYIYNLALCFRRVSSECHVTHSSWWQDDKVTMRWFGPVLKHQQQRRQQQQLLYPINLLQYPHVLGQLSFKKFFICSLLSVSTSSQSILNLPHVRVSTHSFTTNKKESCSCNLQVTLCLDLIIPGVLCDRVFDHSSKQRNTTCM